MLLNEGTRIHARNAYGATPLHLAAQFNPDTKLIELMLRRGASVNAEDPSGSMPLLYAAWSNPEPRVMAVLLDSGADINAVNAYGETRYMGLRRILRNQT